MVSAASGPPEGPSGRGHVQTSLYRSPAGCTHLRNGAMGGGTGASPHDATLKIQMQTHLNHQTYLSSDEHANPGGACAINEGKYGLPSRGREGSS